MSTPLFARRTTAELIEERNQLVKSMPLPVETLRRLRDFDAIAAEEAELLEKYESLTWLIDG